MRSSVTFYLNGKKMEATGDAVFKTVAEYLRYDLGLTGTKIVCAEGDCGACTVLRARPGERLDAINSCIALVAHLDCCHVVTIEGIAEEDSSLSSVQKAMVDCHGSQCGYCTPGFVMAMSWMMDHHKKADEKCVKNHLTGNLCRCTGYKPIVDAALSIRNFKSVSKRYLNKKKDDELKKIEKTPVEIKTLTQHYYAPTTLKSFYTFRKKHPHAIILGAATDLGVLLNKGKKELSYIVSLRMVKQLEKIKVTSNKVYVGANITLAALRKKLKPINKGVAGAFDLFASPQIKNIATLSGNVANASPIGDTPPVLLALNARVHAHGRVIPLDKFFISYRKTALKKNEIIEAIEFDLPKKGDFFIFKKITQRKDLDISCVNFALFLRKNQSSQIKSIRFALGGVGPTPMRIKKVESFLSDKVLSDEHIQDATDCLSNEIKPLSDLRGSKEYRMKLSQNLLRSCLQEAQKQ